MTTPDETVPVKRSPKHRPLPAQIWQPGAASLSQGRVLIRLDCPPHTDPDVWLLALAAGEVDQYAAS